MVVKRLVELSVLPFGINQAGGIDKDGGNVFGLKYGSEDKARKLFASEDNGIARCGRDFVDNLWCTRAMFDLLHGYKSVAKRPVPPPA